mgnify:CR=1 FL=1
MDGLAYRDYVVDVTGDPLTIFMDTLPAGVYAIKLYHDENSNNECDMNLLGIPTEKFGFSNKSINLALSPLAKTVTTLISYFQFSLVYLLSVFQNHKLLFHHPLTFFESC